jgi:tRNA-dihydrouridine synthase B
MALSFGNVTLHHGLLLAPMAGVTDLSFRLLCRQHGAEYTVTEMISAKALVLEQRARAGKPHRTAPLAAIDPSEPPAAVQIFGHEPDMMATAAALLATGTYKGAADSARPVAIDINMGCPVAKVVGNGEGSALMKDPDTAVAIVRAVKAAVTLPVTVKLRAGWDDAHKNAPELARRLEDAGADLLCVHGRTRQ